MSISPLRAKRTPTYKALSQTSVIQLRKSCTLLELKAVSLLARGVIAEQCVVISLEE